MVLLDKEGGWSPPFELMKATRELADRLDELGTFPVQVGRLRYCGLPWALATGGVKVLFCDQRFCPMCRPRWQRQSKRKWWPKITAILGMQGEVMALTLTRPPHSGTLFEQKGVIRQKVAKMFDRRQWKGPHGFIHRVGILLVVEIGTEGAHDGLVHVHVLVVSPDSGVALAAAEWMRDIWLELNPDASPLAQDISACNGPNGFDAWLNYILKGSNLDPTWEDEQLEAMVQALTDGSHRLTSYGLLRTPRRKQNRQTRIRMKAEDSKSAPIGFGHPSVDTCCLKVSTLAEEKSSTVDNISRVSSHVFGLDQSSVLRDPEHLNEHPPAPRRARRACDNQASAHAHSVGSLARPDRRGYRRARRAYAADD